MKIEIVVAHVIWIICRIAQNRFIVCRLKKRMSLDEQQQNNAMVWLNSQTNMHGAGSTATAYFDTLNLKIVF